MHTTTRCFLLISMFFAPLLAAGTAGADELPRRDGAEAETHPGLAVEYGAVEVGDGVLLRTILTRPADADDPPVIYFTQWLSCDTVELRADRQDGWAQMLRGMIRDSGWAVMRTDKRGIGDSGGGPCSKLDYDTELADHRVALAALQARDDIDPARIVVFGASMGSRMAPQLAAGRDGVVGVLTWGGGARTWFERMLAFDRNAMELGAAEPDTIAARMKAHARFHAEYLLAGRDPRRMIEAEPELASVWADIIGTDANSHYGRPFSFHHQAQRADWTAAWAQVDVPVLVVMGEHDWFESRAGHETVVRVVNRDRPGLARFETIPGMDHHFSLFASAPEAFRDETGRADARPFLELAIGFLDGLD